MEDCCGAHRGRDGDSLRAHAPPTTPPCCRPSSDADDIDHLHHTLPIAVPVQRRGDRQQVPLDRLTNLTITCPARRAGPKILQPQPIPGRGVAKNNTYPTAMVMVLFKLDGAISTVPAAMAHANDDRALAKDFVRLNCSSDDFDGFPRR